jgi:hypothetical protein
MLKKTCHRQRCLQRTLHLMIERFASGLRAGKAAMILKCPCDVSNGSECAQIIAVKACSLRGVMTSGRCLSLQFPSAHLSTKGISLIIAACSSRAKIEEQKEENSESFRANHPKLQFSYHHLLSPLESALLLFLRWRLLSNKICPLLMSESHGGLKAIVIPDIKFISLSRYGLFGLQSGLGKTKALCKQSTHTFLPSYRIFPCLWGFTKFFDLWR